MTLEVCAPFAGRVLALDDVPDPVFAQGMVGHGSAVLPPDDADALEVLSPAAGTVLRAMPHAVVIVAPDGTGILVHVGLDTVGLRGRGFELLVEKRQAVAAGEPLVRVRTGVAREAGLSLCTPVVAMDTGADRIVAAHPPGDAVTAGQRLFALAPAP